MQNSVKYESKHKKKLNKLKCLSKSVKAAVESLKSLNRKWSKEWMRKKKIQWIKKQL